MSSSMRTTRIPVSRARTGSVSSSHQPSLNGMAMNARGDSRNGYYKTNGTAYGSELTADLWPVDEAHQPASYESRSTLKSLRSGMSELVNEKPPFNPNSRRVYEEDLAPRMSTDSEERPFEHWYRGDVSRNGGVGELRVGRRQEMLDIANYGHTLRQASSRTAFSTSSRSRSNSRGRDTVHSRPPTRSRAESVGARESIYLEEENLAQGSFVLDERPPTDIDSDGEAYGEGEYYEEDTTVYGRENGTVSPHSLDRSDTPTLVDLKSSGFKSRIPTPTLRTSGSRSATPTGVSPPPLEVPPTPKASSPPTPSTTSPKPSAATSTAKRRAKSPAATSPAAAKRSKKPPAKAKPTPPKKDDRSRESVAQYPSPEGDDIMHAVPSWTQPVPKSGNWDDVVLPVVARKKGLEDHYVPADGSPKPKPVRNIIEPAPGTFGFDHAKYRDRNGSRPEEISMDEFAQRLDELPNPEPKPKLKVVDTAPRPQSPLAPPPRMTGSSSPVRAESPAPFSQYSAPVPIPEIRVIRASSDNQQKVDTRGDDEGGGGGCCKCVIM
ncbi:hypothetical protein PsYK624_080630 [Phanerochaete sordida]|uniref:Uncharacterized protein n=1 Tax=Phanerochaete sordida TaxID=48140 RepID=A0A9P3GBN3_9APHY|nr:hypothetical protein PsYK624_080630 [Phanerochaete sordida]